MARYVEAGQVTNMPVCEPAIEALTVSVALTVWVPYVIRVTLKTWTPLSAPVKV